MDCLQHLGSLAETEEDVFLDQGELDLASQLFQLLQLCVGLREERLLVFLAAQGEESPLAIIASETLFSDCCLPVREVPDPRLILLQLVPLVFKI